MLVDTETEQYLIMPAAVRFADIPRRRGRWNDGRPDFSRAGGTIRGS